MTTGPDLESKAWWQALRGDVVWDAKARGLPRDALDSFVFVVLVIAAAIPAACFWAVWGLWPAAAVVAGAALLLGWIRGRFPQRETAAGVEAASRWLGSEPSSRRTRSLRPDHLWRLGVTVALMAGRDRGTIEFTGPVLRLRAFGDDDDGFRYYAAVDDSSSRELRAFRVTERQYARLRQGQLVTVRATPVLGCVRALEPAAGGLSGEL